MQSTCCNKISTHCSKRLPRACTTQAFLFVHQVVFRNHKNNKSQPVHPHSAHHFQPARSSTTAMWSYVTTMWGSSGTTDVPLPTDKLCCDLPVDTKKDAVILLNCGSFNPPTIMHLRMLDVAAQVLRQVRSVPLLCCCQPYTHIHQEHQYSILVICWLMRSSKV